MKASQTVSDKHFSNLRKLAKYTELKVGIVIYAGKDLLTFGKISLRFPFLRYLNEQGAGFQNINELKI